MYVRKIIMLILCLLFSTTACGLQQPYISEESPQESEQPPAVSAENPQSPNSSTDVNVSLPSKPMALNLDEDGNVDLVVELFVP